MAEVVWTEGALRRLREVHDWIAHDSPGNAARIVRRIEHVVEQLQAFPESGRTVPERSARGYRELIVGTYRVVYRYDHDRDTVVIVTVLHGRQQFRLPPTIRGQ
jgi:toxin ParE1/3/4